MEFLQILDEEKSVLVVGWLIYLSFLLVFRILWLLLLFRFFFLIDIISGFLCDFLCFIICGDFLSSFICIIFLTVLLYLFFFFILNKNIITLLNHIFPNSKKHFEKPPHLLLILLEIINLHRHKYQKCTPWTRLNMEILLVYPDGVSVPNESGLSWWDCES